MDFLERSATCFGCEYGEAGGGKREEGGGKREEGRGKREEGRGKGEGIPADTPQPDVTYKLLSLVMGLLTVWAWPVAAQRFD